MSISADELRSLFDDYPSRPNAHYPRLLIHRAGSLHDPQVPDFLNQLHWICLNFIPIVDEPWEGAAKETFTALSNKYNDALKPKGIEGAASAFLWFALEPTEVTPVLSRPLNLKALLIAAGDFSNEKEPFKALVLSRRKAQLRRTLESLLEESMSTSACLNAIELFTGTDPDYDVMDFVEAVERAREAGNWSDKDTCVFAHLKLRGNARQWLKSDTDLPSLAVWATFKAALKTRFEPKSSVSELYRMLQTCMQGPEETVANYANRLQIMAQRVNRARGVSDPTSGEREVRRKILEKDLKAQFLRGLKPDLSRFVRVRSSMGTCKTFQDLVDAATDVRRYLRPCRAYLYQFFIEDLGGGRQAFRLGVGLIDHPHNPNDSGCEG